MNASNHTTTSLKKYLPILGALAVVAGSAPGHPSQAEHRIAKDQCFPCREAEIRHYTAYRTGEAIRIDGHLDEVSWKTVPRSPRFVDLISGTPTIHDTRAAVLWDETNLYVGFWIEEPHVRGDLTDRDASIWQNNDVEVFIAGKDSYFEFEINALGTIYDSFLIWEEAYEEGGFAEVPDFRKTNPNVKRVNGVDFKTHPRGTRLRARHWTFPGLQAAVHVDGTLNDDRDRDRGWSVEVAFAWKGMKWLAKADGRSLPPKDGDEWRIDFSRFNQYKEAPPARDSSGWAWSSHGIWDSHIPECFPYIHFSERDVRSVEIDRPSVLE